MKSKLVILTQIATLWRKALAIPRYRKLMLAVFLTLVLLGAVKSAQAQVITHYFTGTITSVSGTPFGLSPSVGQQVQGSFTYDTSLPPNFDTGSVAGYIQPPPSGMSVVISGVTLQSQNYNSFQVLNNAFGVDNLNGFFTPILVNGNSSSDSMSFSLADNSQTAFTSTALPPTLNLTSFNNRTGSIFASSGSVSFSIDTLSENPPPPTIPVTIDVKPGSYPNSINPKSQGVIPVAILTTDTFDATTVDSTTVLFGVTGTEAAPMQSSQEDVDGDGNIDMILHFENQDTGIQCGDTSVTLTGETNGQAIEGSDTIETVGC